MDVQHHSVTYFLHAGAQPLADAMVAALALALLGERRLYQSGALPCQFYPNLLVPMRRCLHSHPKACSAWSSAHWSGLGSQG